MNSKYLNHGRALALSVYEAISNLTRWPAILFSAILGATASFAFAPYHLTILLIPSFTGLLWMLDGLKSRDNWFKAAFMRGWAFGFGYFLVGLYWTAYPFLVDIERHLAYIWLAVAVLPMGMALITGLAVGLASVFWSSSPLRIFIFSFFFTLGELIRGYLFGGLPWNLAGTTFVPGNSLSQAASLGGVYWLTLLVIFGCSSVATLADKQTGNQNYLYRVSPFVLSTIIFAGLWIWGSNRISQPNTMTEQRVVLVDSGVPQKIKFEVEPSEIVAQYTELLDSIAPVDRDTVILPEGAIPALFDLSSEVYKPLFEKSSPRKLLIGSLRSDYAFSSTQKYYNSLIAVDTESSNWNISEIYDKRRLVPLGELPASKIVPFGEYISGLLPPTIQRMAQSGFEPGNSSSNFLLDEIPPFTGLICYEGIFPAFVRESAEGANWLLIVSNDAWFGKGAGPAQNAVQNRYRAIELGLPLVRVASMGETGITDAYGRTTLESNPFVTHRNDWQPTIARGYLPKDIPATLYRKNGSQLLWFTLLIWLIIPFIGFVLRK